MVRETMVRLSCSVQLVQCFGGYRCEGSVFNGLCVRGHDGPSAMEAWGPRGTGDGPSTKAVHRVLTVRRALCPDPSFLSVVCSKRNSHVYSQRRSPPCLCLLPPHSNAMLANATDYLQTRHASSARQGIWVSLGISPGCVPCSITRSTHIQGSVRTCCIRCMACG